MATSYKHRKVSRIFRDLKNIKFCAKNIFTVFTVKSGKLRITPNINKMALAQLHGMCKLTIEY